MALLEEATRHKDLGNALLGQHRYTQAVEQYTKAISLCPTAIFLSNRAQAYIKLESYGLAIQDADEATRLDPSYVKAYYRRGSAHFALGKLKDAKKDFKGVLALVPADAEANKKLKACEKAIREEAFLKAIESDVAAVAPYSDVDPASIPLESDYDGPHLTDCGPEGSGTELVTLEFVRAMVERFRATKLVAKRYVVQMLLAARTLFRSLPSLIRVQLPVDAEGKVGHFTVCGDTHGQFYDLCHIFEKGGFPSESNPFLFNGDYVDRGSFSFEVVMTLIALKLACPSALHLLRGNHETKNMNKIYGFEGEVRAKYDDRVMGLFAEVFSWLPLAAVLQDSVFVVHGGLSTQDEGRISLAQIESTPRGREPPESGLMSDLLWSDPQLEVGRSPSKRGVGFSFGPDYTQRFLDMNGLSLMVRSHEVKDEGYVVEHDDMCITIFSAPNYCDQMGNKGAFVRFKADLRPQFTQFEAVWHPNVPPMRYASMFSQFGL